ncbi:MAG: SDR family NAD(P)-dependent oxidoreductase [Burkholderiaceae bacterium]|nr:SDR family NAD(P)-dependent oxidoreductase [Burkholderiaceae bacterium]
MLNYGLKDRVVFVTGAGSGIGRATALLAAADGARVVVAGLTPESADTVVEEIRSAGGQALGVAFDVRDSAATEDAVARAEADLGPIDGFVGSAGVGGPAPAETMSDEIWSTVIDTNLTGLFNSIRSVGRRMVARQRGSIVAIGSSSALGGTMLRAHYSASKHGVIGMVRALAIEWGPRGVRVNCVSPGPVDTPLLRRHWSQERIDRVWLNRIPLKRLASAEDQARGCLFMLSDASSYITGSVLPVNGGLSAGYSTNLSEMDASS